MAGATQTIRTFGDPVLKSKCALITEIDAALHKLVEDMVVTMYKAPGVGLAGPQIGVQKQVFVYDDGSGAGARTLLNPVIHETSGTFEWDEGCLSVPGLYFPILRPNKVHITGLDMDGNDVEMEADGFLGRILQHETDHLNGMLLLERLDPTQRKQALRTLREQAYTK